MQTDLEDALVLAVDTQNRHFVFDASNLKPLAKNADQHLRLTVIAEIDSRVDKPAAIAHAIRMANQRWE